MVNGTAITFTNTDDDITISAVDAYDKTEITDKITTMHTSISTTRNISDSYTKQKQQTF